MLHRNLTKTMNSLVKTHRSTIGSSNFPFSLSADIPQSFTMYDKIVGKAMRFKSAEVRKFLQTPLPVFSPEKLMEDQFSVSMISELLFTNSRNKKKGIARQKRRRRVTGSKTIVARKWFFLNWILFFITLSVVWN